MNIVSVEGLSKAYGTKSLFEQLTFGIESGEKIGLIGVNGTGKTTFLKVLAGWDSADQGQVISGNSVHIDYLPQNPEFTAGSTVLEQVFRGGSPVMQLLRDYEGALEKLQHHPDDPGLQQNLLQLSARMDQQGAWQLETEAKTVLTRLGISDFEAKVDTLSGGMRKRVALAGTLITPADLLILDEPTNHLDYETVNWLEDYLNGRKGALLMVTHDRYFLDRVVGKIFELDQGRLYTYEGNYSTFLEAKMLRLEQAEAAESKRQNILRNELAWIRRGAQARSTKQKARIDRFHQLKAREPEKGPEKLEISAGSSRLGKKVIELSRVGKRFAHTKVIDDFSYIVSRDDRIGIIGPNGYGKSTLLNLIAGRTEPDAGALDIGPTVKIGYFAQENGEMDESMRVIDSLKAIAEVLPSGDGGLITASQLLERFLFPSALQYLPIARLSGGEKRRLYLLHVLMGAPNVILLDEPTNDLDIQTLTILEDYLDDFPGVVMAVSHDRYFLDRVAEKIFVFEGEGVIVQHTGNYSDYMESARSKGGLAGQAGGAANGPTQGQPHGGATGSAKGGANAPAEKRDRALKFSFNEQREFAEIDGLIARAEKELAEIDEQVNQAGSDYSRLQDLVRMQQEAQDKLERLIERWTYLNELAEEIEKSRR